MIKISKRKDFSEKFILPLQHLLQTSYNRAIMIHRNTKIQNQITIQIQIQIFN